MEARLRSAVSRRYYGLFHQIRLKLLEQGAGFQGGVDIHQQVVQALRTSADPLRFKLGVSLGRLRQHRNSADYDDTISNVAQLVNASSTTTISIMQQIAAINWNARV